VGGQKEKEARGWKLRYVEEGQDVEGNSGHGRKLRRRDSKGGKRRIRDKE